MSVEFETRGPVGLLTLDRPPVNAFDEAQVSALDACLDQVEADPDVHVLLVRSAGARFSAGADIALLERWAADVDGAQAQGAFAASLQQAFGRVAQLAIPTIAAVRGFATGGGLELALACDLRVVAAGARLGLTEVRLGLVPGAGGTQRLTELLGPSRSLQLMFTGSLVDGAEAERIGLATVSCPDEDVEPRSVALAEEIAQWPRGALTAIKDCVRAVGADGYAKENEYTRLLNRQPETKELIARFFASRRG